MPVYRVDPNPHRVTYGTTLGVLVMKSRVPCIPGSVSNASTYRYPVLYRVVEGLDVRRLPDAPAGTKGISLFLAPKLLPDGRRNAIRCDGIEKKMGIKGSATCAMSFDGATGWLIGDAHRGLNAMFVMMNSARLHVALQGLGHLEAAQQNALAYARERIQGRGQPIAAHPAVRRTLWSLRALAEGQRVIAYWAAMLLDEAYHHPDAARRALADDAWCGQTLQAARFGLQWLLLEAAWRWQRVRAQRCALPAL